MRRCIFLDRDGVINKVSVNNGKPYSPRKVSEFEFLPYIEESLQVFKNAGFLNIVITNQPDIARCLMNWEELDKMHGLIKKKLSIDDIFVCPHDDFDNCQCRKPKPGMLLEASKKWDIDLKSSFLVGDSWRDIEAGKAVGCRSILVATEYNKNEELSADFRAPNITTVMKIILEEGVK